MLVWPRKPPFLGIGKAWISLDSLVRIEPFQWVRRDFRWKEFLAPFAAGRQRRSRRQRSWHAEAQDWSSTKLNSLSDFPQSIAVEAVPLPTAWVPLTPAPLPMGEGFSLAPVSSSASRQTPGDDDRVDHIAVDQRECPVGDAHHIALARSVAAPYQRLLRANFRLCKRARLGGRIAETLRLMGARDGGDPRHFARSCGARLRSGA
jgi:hypothetical protein